MNDIGGEITLLPMTLRDIPLGIFLKSEANWNQEEADWEFLIKNDKGGNFIASYKGQDAGTITTLTYQYRFCWIGMVLVNPLFRGAGIGTALLKQAINWAGSRGTIRLDATPQGQKLYEQLDFKVERQILRFERDSRKPWPVMDSNCKVVTPLALSEIMKTDSPIFGAERGMVLNYLFQNAPQYAFYLKKDNQITGFCLGRSGSNFEQIGPLVAESVEDAHALIVAAGRNSINKPIIVDSFSENIGWLAQLHDLGFTVQRPFIRMYFGALTFPGLPAKQYAIAGPELG